VSHVHYPCTNSRVNLSSFDSCIFINSTSMTTDVSYIFILWNIKISNPQLYYSNKCWFTSTEQACTHGHFALLHTFEKIVAMHGCAMKPNYIHDSWNRVG
jgi:hypothetical protein